MILPAWNCLLYTSWREPPPLPTLPRRRYSRPQPLRTLSLIHILTPATLFLASGQVAQAADVLYKRPIVLMRGSFNPVCNLHLEVMSQVKKCFLTHINETQADRCMEICEISMNLSLIHI